MVISYKISMIELFYKFIISRWILGDTTNTTGRLLTPEEGCGYTKVKNTRIVGGSLAPVGAWPWLALLAFTMQDGEIAFDCIE